MRKMYFYICFCISVAHNPCACAVGLHQALDFGLPAHQVFQTSGMILRPSFYEPDEDDSLDSAERLRKIGREVL